MLNNSTLRKAIIEFTEVYPKELNLQPTTVKNKRNAANRLLAYLGSKPFSLETVRDYIASINKKGWKVSSVRNEIKNIKALAAFLYKRKYMKINIAPDIASPKQHKDPLRLVSPDIAEKIIIAGTDIGKGDRSRSIRIKKETQLALRFILRTGLRISEIQKLRGEDLNLNDDPPTFFVHSKGGDMELMPFPRDMVEELKDRRDRERVFEITQETCNDVLQRGAKILGITQRMTNHTLRHIFATSSLKNGIPLPVVSRLLRHDNIGITDEVYTHYDISDLSFALNNQPIIRQGLTADEMFDTVERAIKQTGIVKDKRFKSELSREKDTLVIKLTTLTK